MNSFTDGVRSLTDAHSDKLAELAAESTVGMSVDEIAQSIENGRREIVTNLRSWGIHVDY